MSLTEKSEADKDADISDRLHEIDGLLYKLYRLTPEEIKIIEESAK